MKLPNLLLEGLENWYFVIVMIDDDKSQIERTCASSSTNSQKLSGSCSKCLAFSDKLTPPEGRAGAYRLIREAQRGKCNEWDAKIVYCATWAESLISR